MAPKEIPGRLFNRRTLLIALPLLVLLLALAVPMLVPNLFRPVAERIATEATGLPAQIGDLDFSLLPAPRLVLRNVVLGDRLFGAKAESIDAELTLGSLLSAQPRATLVTLNGTQLFLPEDFGETGTRFGDVVAVGRAEGADSEGGTEVLQVVANGIQVLRAGQPWANADVTLDGVTAPQLRATAALRSLAEGSPATFNADLTYDKPKQELTGTVAFDGLVRSLLTELGEQDLNVKLTANVSGNFREQVSAQVQGSFDSARYQQQGTLAGVTFWKDGLLIANDLEVLSADCEVRMDATLTPGVETAFEIYRAAIGPQTLALWSALLAPPSVSVAIAEDASLTITELLGAWPLGDEASPRFMRGSLSVQGLTLSPVGQAAWPPLAGVATSIRIDQNQVTIESLEAKGLSFTGEAAAPAPGEPLRLNLEGTVDLASLDLAQLPSLESLSKADGVVAFAPLQIIAGAGQTAVTFAGDLQKVGFTAQLPNTTEPISAKGIGGRIAYDGTTLTLEKITSDGLAVNGTVGMGTPMQFALTGQVDLAHPLVQLASASTPLTAMRGQMTIAKLEGSVDRTTSALSGLVVEGAVKSGGFTATLGNAKVKATDLAGDFNTSGSQVSAKFGLQSDELGAVQWDGTLDTKDNQLNGALTLNLARAASAFAPALQDNALAQAVVAAYGDSKLAITAQLPSKSNPASFTFKGEGKPPIAGSVGFVRSQDGIDRLGAIELDTTIPLDGISVPGALPVIVSGTGTLNFTRDAEGKEFRAGLNLDQAEIRAGDYLRKPPGEVMSVDFFGSGTTWQPTDLFVNVGTQSIQLAWNDGALGTDKLALDLGLLSPLFPPNVQTRGRIDGSLHLSPLRADLQLSSVGLALSEGLRADELNGGLGYADGVWTFSKFRVLAADSDFTIDAGLREGAWAGVVSGNRLNLNAMQAMQPPGGGDGGSDGSGASSSGSDGLTGELEISLSEVLYRNATLTNVLGTLRLEPGRIELAQLRANAGAGSVAGDILYLPATNDKAGSAALQLTTTGADAAVIDGLLFPEPRGLQGALDARVDLRFPISNATPPYMGMDGSIDFVAKNGTFGQAGFATRVLSVLRTTEILRLRLPGFGDQGLVFDTTSGTFTATRGVVQLERFDLTSKSYAFDAAGGVDFPSDKINVEGRMHILESVTGIVGAVPIVGNVVDSFKASTGLVFVITGSPFNVKVTPKSGTNPIRDTRQGVRDAVKDVKKIGDLFGL
jgi:hypothetical protein